MNNIHFDKLIDVYQHYSFPIPIQLTSIYTNIDESHHFSIKKNLEMYKILFWKHLRHKTSKRN